MSPKDSINSLLRANPSALDKLLGQFDIYAKTIAYCLIFYATFFTVITHVFLLNEAIVNVPAYSLPASAFIEYETSGFYCT